MLALGAMPASAEVPNLEWTALLPPIPTAKNPQPGPVSTCPKPNPGCIRTQIRRLRAARDKWGCDHRAVFATTYLMLTKQIFEDVKTGFVEENFLDPKYLYAEDALFANVYFRTARAYGRGARGRQGVADRLRHGGARTTQGAVQDMLLGINAHVQNDMPFVLAHLGLQDRDGPPGSLTTTSRTAPSTAVTRRWSKRSKLRFDELIGPLEPAGLSG